MCHLGGDLSRGSPGSAEPLGSMKGAQGAGCRGLPTQETGQTLSEVERKV